MNTGFEKNEQWPLSTKFNAFSDTRFWKPWIWIWLGPISSFSSIVLVRLEKKSGIPEYSLKKEDLEIRKGFIQRIHSTLHLFKAVEIEIHTCASAMCGEAGLAESLPTAFIWSAGNMRGLGSFNDSFPIHVFLQALHLEMFRILHWFQHSSAWHFSWCTRWKYWMDSSNGHFLLFLRLCAIGTPDFTNKYSSSQLSPNKGFNPILCRRT